MNDLLTYTITQEYLESLVPEREKELLDMEAYAEANDFPIIGPVCGYYCYQLARMIGARSVFELGSGFGYSTAWFAKAVSETCSEQGQSDGGGVVHHTVWDERLSGMARRYLAAMGIEHGGALRTNNVRVRGGPVSHRQRSDRQPRARFR